MVTEWDVGEGRSETQHRRGQRDMRKDPCRVSDALVPAGSVTL